MRVCVCHTYCYTLLLCVKRTTRKSFKITRSWKSRKEYPQKLTQLSSRSHPRHLVGKSTAQKDTIVSDSQVNSNFPYRWSPASLTFNNYFYLFSTVLVSFSCFFYPIIFKSFLKYVLPLLSETTSMLLTLTSVDVGNKYG